MGVLVEVMPCHTPRLSDRQKLTGKVVVPGRDSVKRGEWQSGDGALHPDYAVHRQREVGHPFVRCNAGQRGIPGTPGRIVVVIQSRLIEGESGLFSRRQVEQKCLPIEKLIPLGRGRDDMCDIINIVPDYSSMERNNEDKWHKECLTAWQCNGSEHRKCLRMKLMMTVRILMGNPDRVPDGQSERKTDKQNYDHPVTAQTRLEHSSSSKKHELLNPV